MPTDGTTLRRITTSLIVGMVTFVILASVLMIAWRLFQQHDPVITTNPPHVVPNHVKAGAVMHVEADFRDMAVCSTDTGRFIWRYSPKPIPEGEKPRKEYVILQSTHVSFSDPGVNHPLLDIQVPPWVDPGEWLYFARSERTCGLWDRIFGPDIGHTPDSPVLIEPAG